MEKWKRSARMVDMTQRLLDHPYTLLPLTTFAKRYQAAKSSISEDLAIINEVLANDGSGMIETVAGAAGGVRYIPFYKEERVETVLDEICEELSNPVRILPGGFLYMSDLLGKPQLMRRIGKVWATVFQGQKIDAIVTVETKGIPLAHAAASFLQVPVVIVRYDTRVTEGSVVTVNTVSGSSRRMKQLSLAKRSLPEGSRVVIIDDFMRAGGTVKGMQELLKEFDAEVVGVGVLADAKSEVRLVRDYVSLVSVLEINEEAKTIVVDRGNALLKEEVEMPK
ncbi:pur operon repressor [Risungbinella massiliensis]|uniref:pur operon repressor n=1 Tax=Risungbinella massiliensis TaxID=1329796 RepID=UPI0005CBE37C|nr:pur operon repressor [Risungbinella massiliensis]